MLSASSFLYPPKQQILQKKLANIDVIKHLKDKISVFKLKYFDNINKMADETG